MVKLTIFLLFMFPNPINQATHNYGLNTSLLNGQGSKQSGNHHCKESTQGRGNQTWLDRKQCWDFGHDSQDPTDQQEWPCRISIKRLNSAIRLKGDAVDFFHIYFLPWPSVRNLPNQYTQTQCVKMKQVLWNNTYPYDTMLQYTLTFSTDSTTIKMKDLVMTH